MKKNKLNGLLPAFVGECTLELLEHEWASKDARQYYHGVEHSLKDLPTSARRCLKCICGAEAEYNRYMALAMLGCAGHDLLQEYEVKPHFDGSGIMVRTRKRPGNEDATAELVESMLLELNPKYDSPLSGDDIAAIVQGIRYTAPEFDFKLKTVYQKRLNDDIEAKKKIHPVAFAIAFADLAPSGKSATGFARGGDELLLEEQIEIAKRIREANHRSDIGADDQARYLNMLKTWDAGQADFALGRYQYFLKEIAIWPAEAQALLTRRFNKFPATAAYVARKAFRRSTLSFWEYVDAVGFPDAPAA